LFNINHLNLQEVMCYQKTDDILVIVLLFGRRGGSSEWGAPRPPSFFKTAHQG